MTLSEHDCDHPADSYLPERPEDWTWTCPVCGRVWNAHVDVYWALADD